MKKGIFESGSEGKNLGNDDNIVNMKRRSNLRLYGPRGNHGDFPLNGSVSSPDEKGNWEQDDWEVMHLDDQGNPLPRDFKGVSVSHEGRIIPPERLAVCASRLHQHGISRNIYVDVDGIVTEQGAICSSCLRRRAVFYIAVIALGTCLLIGLVKGLGWL